MNKLLKLLLFANSVDAFGNYLLIPLFALFVKDIGGGPELAGTLFATQLIVSSIVGGLLALVKDRKALDVKLLKVSFIIRTCAWLLLVFIQTIPVMFMVQAALGVALAIYSPSFFSLVSEHLDKSKHIRDWSIWSASVDFSHGLGSLASGFIIISFGFTPMFIIIALLEFISLIISSKAVSVKSIAQEV